MKNSIKFLIKINPNYINKIEDEELTEEMVLYALKCGFKYQNDINNRYSKYYSYVLENLDKDKNYLVYLINDKNFNYSSYNKNQIDSIINYIINNNPNLIIDCINKDNNFVRYLNKEILDKVNKNRLYDALIDNNVDYISINKDILSNNNELALIYLKNDFSNIKDVINYVDINSISNEVLEIFNSNINNNVEYLNYISSLINDSYEKKDDIVDILKYNSIEINENTPEFVFSNKYSTFNLLIHNIEKSYLVKDTVNFNNEEQDELLNIIRDKNIIFDEIPIVFSGSNKIIEQIMKNNPDIIDSNKFKIYNSIQYKYIYDLIMEDKYNISDKTNNELLNNLFNSSGYLFNILNKNFNVIKLLNNINISLTLEEEKMIYDVCKKNNYSLSKDSPLLFKKNYYLVMDALENNKLELKDIDLSLISFLPSKEKLSLINYCVKNNINDNKIINEWRKELITSFSKGNDKVLYIKSYYDIINLPDDITEIFMDSNELNDINKVIDLIKKSNCNVKKIVVDLPNNTVDLNYLNSISDKDMVYFGSEKDITRFRVDDLINLENIMDLMVKDIKESNMSPYEKYIAVYNIVRSFKKYEFYQYSEKEDKKISDQSRNTYLILVNDWMVCVGFARLLVELLKRVGIYAKEWRVQATEGHARNYVNIVDEKYGIDGFYMCDPTWDGTQYEIISNMGSHMNMTTKESHTTDKDKFDFSKGDVLNDRLFNIKSENEMLEYLKEYPAAVKDVISSLDPVYYNNIKVKINNPTIDFAIELYAYIEKKINNPISIKKQSEAVVHVQEYIDGKKYSDKEFEEKYNDFIIKNVLGYDNLTYDHEKDVEIETKELLNMTMPQYIEKKKGVSNSAYKDEVLYCSFYKIKDMYIPEYDKIRFDIDFTDNKRIFDITFNGKLFGNKELSYPILEELSNSYNCKIDDWCNHLTIELDSSLNNKNIKEIMEYCKTIRNDFVNLYDRYIDISKSNNI